MRIRVLAVLGAVALQSGCQTSNPNDYMRIGYGPSFEVAHANCELRKGAVRTGYIAIGSPAFVAGAGLGNAIDNAVREDQFMKNCLILQGWKRIPPGQKATVAAPPVTAQTVAQAEPVVSPQYYAPGSWINGAMLEYSAASKECKAGSQTSCATATRLRNQLRSVGIDP